MQRPEASDAPDGSGVHPAHARRPQVRTRRIARMVAELHPDVPQSVHVLPGAGADALAREDLAFALALGRAATADEKHRVVDFVQKVLTTGAGADKSGAMDETAAWSCFTQALLASAEFRYVE